MSAYAVKPDGCPFCDHSFKTTTGYFCDECRKQFLSTRPCGLPSSYVEFPGRGNRHNHWLFCRSCALKLLPGAILFHLQESLRR